MPASADHEFGVHDFGNRPQSVENQGVGAIGKVDLDKHLWAYGPGRSQMKNPLFTHWYLGGLDLPNRIVMAPMTRARAGDDGVPGELTATYYAQRASAALIFTESNNVSAQATTSINTMGLYSDAQTVGWRKVVEAVHAAGGRIIAQLGHAGRVSHPDLLGGALPVAPSAIRPEGEVVTAKGRVPMETPRALTIEEIPGIVAQYVKAATNAKAAGFDGIQIHGGNGYLLDSFLKDGSNKRTDRYGGSIQNRARLPLEIAEAVMTIWSPERLGFRLTPWFSLWSTSDSDPVRTFSYLAQQLDSLGVGFIELTEAPSGPMARPEGAPHITPLVRRHYKGTLIANGGFDASSATALLAQDGADLVSFGVPFIANPDLPRRFFESAPLNAPDRSTFYGGDHRGYTDYPHLPSVAQAA
jgi:N-ethylmaleimide reductase